MIRILAFILSLSLVVRRPCRADRQQRRLLERVERRDLCQSCAREEIRDHVAAILVVPLVPRDEPRDLGQPRSARHAQGQVHPGLCRSGQPAGYLAALRALGLARHHHLRTRRHRDRQTARLLFAAILHPHSARRRSKDPSPVVYPDPGGTERERTLATGLTDTQREEILGFIDKAWDESQWRLEQVANSSTATMLIWALQRAAAGRHGNDGADQAEC